MHLGLIITLRCNAACEHCATNCGPRRREHLGLEEIFRLMDEASKLHDREPFAFDITGGEPFLDFDRLRQIVIHGAGLGAPVACVTNGFWAKSLERAHEKLRILKDAGLTGLSVSASRFHRRYVPLDRVRFALTAAREIGLDAELKLAVTESDRASGGLVDELKGQVDPEVLHMFAVLPWLREGANLDEAEYYRVPGLPEGPCPGTQLCVHPDGRAYGCCAPGTASPFFLIGDAREQSLAALGTRYQHSGKLAVLRREGPIAFARRARDEGLGGRFRASYAHVCDLCLHIASDPDLAAVAEASGADHEMRVVRQAIDRIKRRHLLEAGGGTDEPARVASPGE